MQKEIQSKLAGKLLEIFDDICADLNLKSPELTDEQYNELEEIEDNITATFLDILS